jgi:hypothetical protein
MVGLCVPYSDNTQKASQVNLLYTLFSALLSLSCYSIETDKQSGFDYWADHLLPVSPLNQEIKPLKSNPFLRRIARGLTRDRSTT